MMHNTLPVSIDSPAMRRAGPDLLSLALMDARNHTLHLIGQYEKVLGSTDFGVPCVAELNPPLWELGHVGWFQEWWLGRNLHRQLGPRGDPSASRLASIEPRADVWWNPSGATHKNRWALDLPGVDRIRAYLLDTLEASLELLEQTPDEDDALYFFRLALFHEDRHGEALLCQAQTLGLPMGLSLPAPGLLREPLRVPATRWPLGLEAGQAGFSFDNERPSHDVPVPEFEIDAQPVTWAQFVEFVDDGGYDRPALWQLQGWQWLQEKAAGEGRRGPRYVEQIGVASGAVMQTRFGTATRLPAGQAAMHLTWWEADAWCRWAGRRLPAEVEWELAAHHAARRGFRWGDVWEWTGTTYHPYPGFVADPCRDDPERGFGTHKVLRGASFATRSRMKNPKYRNFCQPGRDDIFVGFRSCAL